MTVLSLLKSGLDHQDRDAQYCAGPEKSFRDLNLIAFRASIRPNTSKKSTRFFTRSGSNWISNCRKSEPTFDRRQARQATMWFAVCGLPWRCANSSVYLAYTTDYGFYWNRFNCLNGCHCNPYNLVPSLSCRFVPSSFFVRNWRLLYCGRFSVCHSQEVCTRDQFLITKVSWLHRRTRRVVMRYSRQ